MAGVSRAGSLSTAASESASVGIRFGGDALQQWHAIRHIVEAGLDELAVKSAVTANLKPFAGYLGVGTQYTGYADVGGLIVEYSAYRVSESAVNIGRITIP